MRGFLSVNIQSLLAPIPAKALFHNIHFVVAISTLFSTLFSVGKLHISTSEDASFCQLLANGRRLPMPFIYSPHSESFADSFLHWKCHGLVGKMVSPYPTLCQVDFWWSPTLVGHPTGPIPRILSTASLRPIIGWSRHASFYESKLVNIKVIGVP